MLRSHNKSVLNIIWILHSWEGDSKNVHPEEMIIDRGEAKDDNFFRRVNILTITLSGTLSGMYYLFYYTEITSYMNGAGEEDAAF